MAGTIFDIVGRHILRLVLVAFVAYPLLRRAQARAAANSDRAQLRRLVWIRFGVTGVIVGALWAWRANAPLWRHAIGLLVGVLLIGPALRWALGRLGRDRPVPAFLRSRRFLVARVSLVLGGLGLQWVLGHWLARATAAYVVGAGLAVVVAVAGPVVLSRANRAPASRRIRRRRVGAAASRSEADLPH